MKPAARTLSVSDIRLLGSRRGDRDGPPGFTLVELLVVVSIIVVLISILVPAMDRAMLAANKMLCLVNQHTIVQACQQYGMEQKGCFPPYIMNGRYCSAYDMRATWDDGNTAKTPMGLGLLPATGLLPTTKLGKVVHCPVIDNTGSGQPPHGMDRVWPGGGGTGGSWWVDPAYDNFRVVDSYNYRAASWYNSGKGVLKKKDAGSSEIITIDLPDLRFGGKYLHPDGYNRAFADGHGGFYNDPNREVDSLIRQKVEPTYGIFDGVGGLARSLGEEYVYEYLSVQR